MITDSSIPESEVLANRAGAAETTAIIQQRKSMPMRDTYRPIIC